jgi:hypothetical protein
MSGSSMRWPNHWISTGRPRYVATRTWCSSTV